jgi:hypothetical protein
MDLTTKMFQPLLCPMHVANPNIENLGKLDRIALLRQKAESPDLLVRKSAILNANNLNLPVGV